MPVVSVVMYFHRMTPFLQPAVRSVLEQTLTDLELVLVDNGVGISAAALGASGRDPRVRLISLPHNLGISGGHNTAVAAARGEFIALLDSDDIALPQRLERQVAALRAEPRLGLVSSRAQQIDDTGAVIGTEFSLGGEVEQRVFTAYTNAAPAPSYTGRADVFRRLPFREQFTFAADYDFLARAVEICPMRGVPDILLHYRRHASQTTTAHYQAQMTSACMIRLLTARRRAGRDENLDAVVTALRDGTTPDRDLREVYRYFAEISLAENFPLLAVYHARKALSVRRTPADCGWAIRVVRRACRRTDSGCSILIRMFLGGPLRAHRLSREG